MAVYTALGAGEVAELLRGFGVAPLHRFSPIAEGIENTNFRVCAGDSEYVLTVFERDSADRVAAVLRVAGTLAERGVPVPPALRTRDGALVAEHRGRPVSLVAFVSGESADAPEEGRLEALGRCLAGLHRCGEDLALPGDAHRPEVLLPGAEALASRLSGEHPELAALIADECHWQGSREPGADLPGGLIHADLFRDNVLFAPGTDRVIALLDFHLAGAGPWLFDLAVVLLDWCWGEQGVDGRRARAVLRGYRSVRSPTGAEHALLPVLLRRAALRYLCLRCERFLVPGEKRVVGVRKDPGEFAARLEFLRGGEADP